jgi:signal-transduction protein with cAMP-binding, CBS, and nucleotidyltransferase domain
MALAMRDRNPSGVSVEEVMTGQVYSVNPEDDVDQALQTMQQHKIRRLPVINPEGELEGILSLNDVMLKANAESAVKTYQAICQHPLPAAATATTGS